MSPISGFITNAGENYLLELLCGRMSAYPAYHVALIKNQQPSQFIGGHELDEPTNLDYARALYANVPLAWTTATGEVRNTLDLPFPVAETEWGVIRHWAICSAEETGDVLWAGTLETPIEVYEQSQVILSPGALTLRATSYSTRVSL